MTDQTCPTCGSSDPDAPCHLHDNGFGAYWHEAHRGIVHGPDILVCNNPFHFPSGSREHRSVRACPPNSTCDAEWVDTKYCLGCWINTAQDLAR